MATVNRDETGSAPSHAGPTLFDGQRLDQPTFHEIYSRMPEDFRAELIEGVVHVASPTRYRHFRSDGLYSLLLGFYASETPGVISGNNGTIKVDPENEFQPDTALLIEPGRGGQVTIDAKGYMVGCPDLVVEVALSTLAVDLNQKRRAYEAAGAREYVVADLVNRAIHWFAREGARLVDLPVGPDGVYRSIAFPGLWLDARAYLDGDSLGMMEALRRGLATPEHAAFADEIGRRRAGRP